MHDTPLVRKKERKRIYLLECSETKMEVNRGENGDEGEGKEERSEDLSGSENSELWAKLSGQEAMPLQPESALLPPLHFSIQQIPFSISLGSSTKMPSSFSETAKQASCFNELKKGFVWQDVRE